MSTPHPARAPARVLAAEDDEQALAVRSALLGSAERWQGRSAQGGLDVSARFVPRVFPRCVSRRY